MRRFFLYAAALAGLALLGAGLSKVGVYGPDGIPMEAPAVKPKPPAEIPPCPKPPCFVR